MVVAKVVRNQMVLSRAEWRGETDNRATTPVGDCPSTASFSVWPYCKNARRDRCQEYHNFFPYGELEETTRMSSNYVDEDYPARPEIKQSLTGWGDNCGSESSTLETDVCVWRYVHLMVLATQEGEGGYSCKDPQSSLCHASGLHNPFPLRRKDLWDISYTSRFITDFVSNLLVMATGGHPG